MPLEQALLEYTNLYVRLGIGRDIDAGHPVWRSYLDGLRSAEAGGDWTYRFYLEDAEANTAPAVAAGRGCFSYGHYRANAVRLHFHNATSRERSPLAASEEQQRRAELASLFAHLKSENRSDLVVVGRSWLYNLAPYRRLFPADYCASARVTRGWFQSMSLWGQFLDHKGGVNEARARYFSEALAARASLVGLDECFPLQVLTAEAPAESFYRLYGV